MRETRVPLVGQAGALHSSTGEYPPQEWEAKREFFTQLYIKEDRTLSEVKSIMESQHSFIATERQYKRRIAAWKLDKNVKDGDMKLMLRKGLKRKLDGKESEFYLNGRLVPSQKMNRFVQRKGITYEEVLEEQAPTPSYITCHTPSATPSEVDPGEMPKGVESQTPLALEGENLEASTQAPLFDSMQNLNLLAQPAPSQVPSAGAINTRDENTNNSSLDLKLQGIFFEPLPPIRSFVALNSGDENVRAEELAHFAARMVGFMWLDTWEMVEYAAKWTSSSEIKPVAGPAAPTTAFLEWTRTVLGTTQISDSVVQLALLYIYLLKKMNPKVMGNPGSEYRVLAIALIIGNKFLDDHVYTTNTWAGVCGMNQTEFLVMEVEFMSNMRYSLFPTREQWLDWRIKMESFQRYLEKAARLQPRILTAGVGPLNLLPMPPAQCTFILQHPALSIAANDVTFLPGHPGRGPRKQPHSQVTIPGTNLHRLGYVSAGSPIIRYVQGTASSPFERCSPRYHLSASPDYYRRDITSTNPLALLSPFPIRSSSVQSTPVLTSALDTTAQPLKPHEMRYRNIESFKENTQSGPVHNELPQISSAFEFGIDWPLLTDADGITY